MPGAVLPKGEESLTLGEPLPNAVNVELTPTQLKFHTSNARFRALIAGIGAGKTFSLCLEALRRTLEQRTSGTIVCGIYRNLTDYIFPMLCDELWRIMGIPDGWNLYFPEFNKQLLVATAINGSKIYFRSADRPDDLRGQTIGWFAIDEAAKLPYQVWLILVGRLRKPPEKAWICTTPKGRNWVYDEFVKENKADYEWWSCPTYENKWLSQSYVKSILDSYSGSFLRQEFYGEFVAHEGLVYRVDRVENSKEAPEAFDVDIYEYGIGGIDFGWQNPSAIIAILRAKEGWWHIVEEVYSTNLTIEQIANKAHDLREKWRIRTFYCDPSRPDYISDLMAAGIDARPGRREIDSGIAFVSNLIDKRRLFVDFDKTPNTLAEFETYSYEERDGNFYPKAKDAYNHAMDAIRYALHTEDKSWYVGSRRGFFVA